MFKAFVLRLSIPLLIAASLAADETVVVRSGNGPFGGTDSVITFLLGPPGGPFDHAFTSADFAGAQNGPAAFMVSPNPLWIPGLPSDPSAQWVGTNPSAGVSYGNTALYAIPFQITSSFSSATLNINYAVDDAIGDTVIDSGPNTGVYLNGSAACGGAFAIGFSQQNSASCGDVSSLLHVGTNWFYIEDGNVEASAGLLFSATITTTGAEPTPAQPNITSVVNAASFAPGSVAPGSIAAVFGSFPLNAPSAAPSVPWPISLSGLTMEFNSGNTSLQAPMVYASGGQVNVQLPWELPVETTAAITATVNGQTSPPQPFRLATFAPGIFSTNGQGSGQGAILDASYRLVDASNPTTPISTIQIYCTGLGAVTNQPADGAPAQSNPLSMTQTTPVVLVGGVSAKVLFSGLAPGFVGVYQVNAKVPASAPTGNAVPVALSIGGVTSNTVTMAIQSSVSLNPQPSITSLSPPSAQAGSGPVTLTINGSGFIPASSVTFNGAPHIPSFVNSSQLTISLTASDLATAGSLPVMVTNPGPGGGGSNSVNFNVSLASMPIPPVPTGLSPGSAAPPGVTVSSLTPTLSWNASPGATGYKVAMLNASTGAKVLAQNISTTSIICPTLESGVTYVWTVWAYNSVGQIAMATLMYFTVAPVQANLTGTWQGAWGSIPDPLAYGGLSATLTQNGTAVTGTITLTFSPCIAGGNVSGTISGNNLSLSLFVGSQQPLAIFLGTIDASGNSFAGAYKVYLGACTGDYGVFTANRSN